MISWIPIKFDKGCKKINEKYTLTMVRQRYQLIPSLDINYQRLLESNWITYTPSCTQQTRVFIDATIL